MRLPNGMGSVYKLTGNRRKPFVVKKTVGWEYNENNEPIQKVIIVGYAKTYKEGLEMLMEYNEMPFNKESSKLTFKDVYNEFYKTKVDNVSRSSLLGYQASYHGFESLHKRIFKDIRLADIQRVFDKSDKNYPTMRKMLITIRLLYGYAKKMEWVNKDYSEFVDIKKFKGRNPNSKRNIVFKEDQINELWDICHNKYRAIILMLIYTGVRISELLDLKTEDVNLKDRYFKVVVSKTENGIRYVPIADKVYPFFEKWYLDNNKYLLHTEDGKKMNYSNYRDTYWDPTMTMYGWDFTPHATRHTTISLLAKANVNQTIIKKIVGHSGAMSLTERVYTHFDIKELLDAINLI